MRTRNTAVLVVKKHSKSMEKITFLESQKNGTKPNEQDANKADPHCDICEGEGGYHEDVLNTDSMQYMHGVGEWRPCPCTLE